jgi:hypothetical protein
MVRVTGIETPEPAPNEDSTEIVPWYTPFASPAGFTEAEKLLDVTPDEGVTESHAALELAVTGALEVLEESRKL